ncbi:MAG: FAD-binding oxidoreductase, partial [Candidatus Wildermuthbacteria bacterium]|nr:FAD-binding oxidoreductase [Candidatus Wildermuthbacteria bacterium]
MDFKKELKTFFKGEVADDSATLERYSKDASLFQVKPRVVVFPKDAEDISSLASFVLKHPEEKLSLTCRSGGSDMSGGPLSESIVIDMAGFNRIEEIGQDFAIAEPGVFYRDFEEETLKKNLLLPCFPASRELCTLGGMVGNNSGGEKTLSFGKIEDYIEKLNVVLADGKEHEFKPLSMDELKIKMSQSDFEGEVYRKTFQLLEENYDVVKSAKPKVSKNSAGYYLWNVYDRERGTFDLTKLFVGSQGTLGIITKAKFKLIHPLPYSSMLVVFLKDETLLAEVTEAVMQEKPEAFELYDDHTIKLALRFFSDFLKILKGNILSLAFRFLPEFFMFLRGGMPKLVLLAEFSGNTPQEVFEKAKK